MKSYSLLLCALLLASPGWTGAQAAPAAASSAKSKVAKARVSKAVKTLRKEDVARAAVVPAHVLPQGLALALSTSLLEPPPEAAPAAAIHATYAPVVRENPYLPRPNPYMPIQAAPAPAQVFAPIRVVPDVKPAGSYAESPRAEGGSLFGFLGQAIPILPDSGQSILPSIKKVYPTGEKPLVVVSFKCPTEVLGVTPPTIKLLHNLVDLGMDGLNKTDLLSFNLQQVCQ